MVLWWNLHKNVFFVIRNLPARRELEDCENTRVNTRIPCVAPLSGTSLKLSGFPTTDNVAPLCTRATTAERRPRSSESRPSSKECSKVTLEDKKRFVKCKHINWNLQHMYRVNQMVVQAWITLFGKTAFTAVLFRTASNQLLVSALEWARPPNHTRPTKFGRSKSFINNPLLGYGVEYSPLPFVFTT